jgi:hypothetical protein
MRMQALRAYFGSFTANRSTCSIYGAFASSAAAFRHQRQGFAARVIAKRVENPERGRPQSQVKPHRDGAFLISARLAQISLTFCMLAGSFLVPDDSLACLLRVKYRAQRLQ